MEIPLPCFYMQIWNFKMAKQCIAIGRHNQYITLWEIYLFIWTKQTVHKLSFMELWKKTNIIDVKNCKPIPGSLSVSRIIVVDTFKHVENIEHSLTHVPI
jgi:hypothetical protein